MGAIGRSKFGRQPPEPVGLNWGHPLAGGIAFAAASHGGVLRDYVSGRLPASGTGTRSDGVYQFGKARRYSAGSDFFTTQASMDAPTRYSWLVRAKWVSISSFSGVFTKTANLGTTNGWGTFSNSGATELYVSHSSGFSASLDNPATLAGIGVCNIVVVWDGNNVHWYRDGKRITLSVYGAAVTSGNGYVKIASNRDTHSSTCWHDHTIVWPGRTLSPAEATYLTTGDASYELFMSRRIWVPVSVGGGVTHQATGALSAQSATLAGSAVDVRTFTSAGAMTAQAATLAGIAAHLTLHTSIGAISAQAATLSGAANHVTIHASSGALTAQAATLSGSANLAVGGAFTAVGALTSQSATVAGTAAHYTLHASTGDLNAQAATLAGVATHLTLHTSTGVLVADPASVSGVAVHSGDGAEVVQPRTGAGKSRRQSQRVVVEIDGEDFIAESPEEAQAILDQAKEAAEEKAKVAIERATKARNRPTRKVMADARKALELPAISAPDLGGYAEEISRQIEDIYQSAIQTIEVAALLRKRELEEEDDEDILLLIA